MKVIRPRAGPGIVILLGAALSAVPARATVEGTVPTAVDSFRLFGSHSATGAALLVPGPVRAEINSVLLTSATAQITDIPFDGEVEAAYLFWAGSQPRTLRSGPGNGPDFDVDFTAADGTFYNDLSALTDPTGFGRCVTTNGFGGFYYCRRDVTDIVRLQGPGNANGIYTVADMEADPGTLNFVDPQWVNAQAKFGAWSLLVVWRAPSVGVRRDVVIFDGFLRLDEDAGTSGQHTFNVGGFLVGSPALGKLTVFAMEGDRQLGVPPEDSSGCPTCFDYIAFRRAGAASPTKLSDGANPPNNSFNSSWNGQASVDIDTYNLGGLIVTGDTGASITVSSGDGVVPAGNGESFFVGWVVVTLDTLTPVFSGNQTQKRVSPAVAGAGQSLFYTIDVVNQGSLQATGVTVTDPMPAGTAYVPGTTRVDGVPRPDVAGASPLVGGLNLGAIPTAAGGDNSRQVTFQVRIADDVCSGSVSNTATISSNEIDPVDVGPANTSIQVVALDTPDKSLSFLSPGPRGPGTVFSYTISIRNDGAVSAGGLSLSDTLPEHMTGISVVAPPGSTFALVGNQLTVDDISVAANSSTDVLVFGRVRTVAELLAAGVNEEDIDGLLISNQGTLSGGCNPSLLTDDPSTPGADATEFSLVYAPILTTSSKTVVDLDGAPLEPGDTVRYTIDVRNTGNRVADVVVVDAIPANTTYVLGSTRLDGAPVADVGGTSALVAGLSLPALFFAGDNDRRVVFDVLVAAAAPNGTTIQNTADLTVPAQPSADHQVQSPALVVVSAPVFSTSTKVVADLGAAPYVPGDDIEYTITIINSGNRNATGVVVTDTLASELLFVSASDGGTATGQLVTWNVGNVAVGATLTRTVRARIRSPLDDGLIVSNVAVIDSVESEPFTTPPVTFEIESSPVLVLTKVDEHPSTPARPGDGVTYRLRLDNNGTMTARDVEIEDLLDGSLESIAAPTGQVSGQLVHWDSGNDTRLAAIDPGSANGVELVVSAVIVSPLPNGTAVSNQATARLSGFADVLSDDPDTASVADPTVFNVVSQATATLSKVVVDLSPGTAPMPGDRVRYTLRVTAAGDAPLTSVVVSDALATQAPALTSVTAVGGTFTAGILTFSAGTGSAGLAALDPGDTVDLTFEATIAAGTADGTVITNQASLSSPVALGVNSDDPAQPGGSDPTRLVVATVSTVDVSQSSKTVTDLGGTPVTIVQPGNDLRYTLRFENRGNAAALSPVVTDAIPATLQILAAPGGTIAGQNVTFSGTTLPALANLEPAEVVTVTIDVRVRAGLNDGTVIDNQAQLAALNLVAPVLTDANLATPPRDPTRVTVDADADLRGSQKQFKNPSTGAVVTTGRPGDLVRIEITLINSGTAAATGVQVRDVLDTARLTNIVPRDGGTLAGGTVTWNVASVPPGVASAVRVRVDAQLRTPQAPGTLSNQGFIGVGGVPPSIPTDDPAQPGAADPTTLQVIAAPQLETSTKNVLGPSRSIDAGSNVRYRIEVRNTGDAPATSVVVRDVLATPLSFVSATSGGTFSAGTRTVTWNVGNLAVGSVVGLEVEATVAASAVNGTTIDNQAVLAAVGVPDALSDDPQVPTPDTPTRITVRGAPQFARFEKTVRNLDTTTADLFRPGDRVEYTFVLENAGNGAATNVEVRDLVDPTLLEDPQPVTPFSLDGDEVVFGPAQVPALASLAPGQSVTLIFTARLRADVTNGATVSNQAFVTSVESPAVASDGDPSTPTVFEPTEFVVSFPELAALKVAVDLNGGDPEPGDVIRFIIAVGNFGTLPAGNLVIRDDLDPGVDLVSAPGATVAGDTLLWGISALAPGEDEQLLVDVLIPEGTPHGTVITNQASISGDGIPPLLTDWPEAPGDEDPVVLEVVALPSFADATKAVLTPDELVKPGDVLTYTLEVPNTGRGIGTAARVVDTVDAHLEIVEVLDGGVADGQELSWDLGTLAPGARPVVRFRARVADDTPNRTTIDNQGLVSAAELAEPTPTDDPSTVDVDDPTRIVVIAEPRLAASSLSVEDLNGGVVEPGDVLRYTLIVRNDGTTAAKSSRAQLSLPAYTSYRPGSFVLNGAPSGAADPWPLALDLAVRSARPGTAEGVVLLDDAVAPDDEWAVMVFELQVDLRAVGGTVISTQGLLNAVDTVETPTDNPATEDTLGDPTVVVVGGGAALVVSKVAVLSGDSGTQGRAEIGDTLRYDITVTNGGDGTAAAVVVEDVFPNGTTYVDGSLRRDGVPLTDAADGDGGDRLSDRLRIEALDIAAGETRAISFEVVVTAGPVVVNQATVRDAGRTWLSDADPTTPGAQPTFTIIDATATVARLGLEVSDLNGGVVEAGDPLRFTAVLRNDGVAVNDGFLELPLAGPLAGVVLVDGDGGVAEPGAVTRVRFARLERGEQRRVVVDAQVAADAVAGDLIEAEATALLNGTGWGSDSLRLLVGAGVGSGGFVGRVFRERGDRDGVYDPAIDEIVSGFSVMAVPAARLAESLGRDRIDEALALRVGIPDQDGRYRVAGLPPGAYVLLATSSEGTVFAEGARVEISQGEAPTADFALDPSGIIYQELDGVARPVAGARVFLVDNDTDADVGAADVGLGQQGQVTTPQGFYKFDVRSTVLPGRFRLRVESPSVALLFPSTLRPPTGQTETEPFGAPAVAGPDGRVVEHDFPNPQADTTYFLRFDLSSEEYFNNHVPLDRLDQRIRIDKSVNKRTASIGEIVTYTVTITNPTDVDIGAGTFGQQAVLIDDLPPQIEIVQKRASLQRERNGALAASEVLAVSERTARQVEFAPFTLPAQSRVVIRYYGVVGIRAKGEQINRVQLFLGNTPISPQATASLRVVDDPIFDEGTVLGRVFCDTGDGERDASEAGLPGARLFLDSGAYVDTDIEGKFHFRGVKPGRHALKLDSATIPAGGAVGDELRDFLLTPGLLAKIDFGVRCAWEQARPTEVTLLKAPPPPPVPTALVTVDPTAPAIALDGTPQPLPLIDVELLAAGDKPNIAAGLGLNLERPGELVWHIQQGERLPLRRWQISIFGLDGTEVWRVEGEGRPPERVPWVLPPDNTILTPQTQYVYRIAAETLEGDRGEGRWRRLGYRLSGGAAGQGDGGPRLWRGDLFDKKDEPSKDLAEKSKALAMELGAAATTTDIQVEVHTSGTGSRSAKLLATQRQAVAVAKLLIAAGVPAERVKALGKGDTEPLMPNTSKKTQALNRRVVIRLGAPAAPNSPAAPIAYPGFLRINGEALSAEPGKSVVEREVEVHEGDVIEVDLRLDNGQRLQLRRPYPFVAPSVDAQSSVQVPVSGSLLDARLILNEVAVDLPLLRATCKVEGEAHRLGEKGLEPPARFNIGAPVPVQSWLLRILNPAGTVLADVGGDVLPSEPVPYSGTSPTGSVVVQVGTYSYRCLLTDQDGQRALSAPGTLRIGDGPSETSAKAPKGGEAAAPKAAAEGGATVAASVVLRDAAYPEVGKLGGDAAVQLGNLADMVAQSPGATLQVEIHEASTGSKMQAQVATSRIAADIKTFLTERGLSAERFSVAALGANRPVMPGASNKAHKLNRRVEAKVLAPPPAAEPTLVAVPKPGEAAPTGPSAPTPANDEVLGPKVVIAGTDLPVDVTGTFAGTVTTESDANLAVDIVTREGGRVFYNIQLYDGKPVAAATTAPLAFAPGTDSPRLGNGIDSLVPAAPPPVDENLATFDGHPSTADSLRGGGAVDGVAGFVPGLPGRVVAPASGPTRRLDPSGPAVRQEPSGPARRAFAPSGPPEPGAGDEAVLALGADSPSSGPVTLPIGEAPVTQAADLWVKLPADGATLAGERLTVLGRADQHNVVRVNGQQIAIDDLGRFVTTLVLPPGSQRVEVSSTDVEGNVARVARTYTVPAGEWFLLALGDGAAGYGQQIAGMNDMTTIDLQNDFYLHGRLSAYFKGRLDGASLFESNPFETLRLTAHLDTGKEAEATLARQLLDPDRYYPVYGDSSEEVQEAESQLRVPFTQNGQVFLELSADKSRLRAGNFQAALQGVELFRYERSLSGVSLDLEHAFVEGSPTEVHAFAASGLQGRQHRQIVLGGTGGAIYFLRDDDLVEGSERVRLVVRDQITGSRLFEAPQSRDVDYVIDYLNGRLTFSQPVPSVVMNGFRANLNPPRTLDGHPVFVEIDYDYEARDSFDGRDSYAVQARQTFFDTLTVGGGIVDEDRSDEGGVRYRLVSGEARLRLLDKTHLEVEVARSWAADGQHLASFDGGLTWGRIGTPEGSEPGQRGGLSAEETAGWALTGRLGGDIGEYIGLATDEKLEGEWLPYTIYGQHQEPTFYAGSAILEQGQSKVGGQLRWLLTKNDELRLRHDGVWSWLFLEAEDRRIVRQLSSLGYEHRGDTWSAGLELGNNFLHDANAAANAGTVVVFGDKRVHERVTLRGEQEVITWTTPGLLDDDLGRLTTRVSAELRIFENLYLNATEAVRWTGENSTQIGLKTKLNDDLSIYASERLTASSHGLVSTTVVGGESQGIPGSRSYAEYQFDALSSGENGRAVFGMDNRWTVGEGLQLTLSYERSQLVGGSTATYGLSTGGSLLAPGVAGTGSGALAQDQMFAASSYAGGGVFPTGVSSRDSFASGLEILRFRDLKGGLRFEMRYDRGDQGLEVPDRLVFGGQAGLEWRLDRLLVALGRARGAMVQNLDAEFTEGQFLDITVGLALRPSHTDDWGGLFKWTRRFERRSQNASLTAFQREISDVIALEPYAELPYGFQLVGKAALKLFQIDDQDLGPLTSTTILALGRINYHLFEMFDAGVEYRYLANMLTREAEHGPLLELAWTPVRYVAVGVGYNFTHFSDDLLADPNTDNHGVFLRVTGRY